MGVNPVTGDRNVEMYLRKTKRGLQLKANARAGKERRIGSVDRRVGLADRKVGQERRSGQDRRKIDFGERPKLVTTGKHSWTAQERLKRITMTRKQFETLNEPKPKDAKRGLATAEFEQTVNFKNRRDPKYQYWPNDRRQQQPVTGRRLSKGRRATDKK